tara:strand:- start:270 stop:797 length:528 start_codon:yes stop_codon:yes gene_type:complete
MAVDPALVGFDVVNTLQDTLLGYVMQNRKLQENARQFNRSLAEQQRQFDFGESRSMRLEDLQKQMRKADKQMFQQAASYRKQRGLQKDWDRKRIEYGETKEASESWLDPRNWFTDEGDYMKEFDKIVGPRPEPRMSGLPQGDFLPQYGTQEYLKSLEYDPNNLLGLLMMQGIGGR